jgi:hypothetical protein
MKSMAERAGVRYFASVATQNRLDSDSYRFSSLIHVFIVLAEGNTVVFEKVHELAGGSCAGQIFGRCTESVHSVHGIV